MVQSICNKIVPAVLTTQKFCHRAEGYKAKVRHPLLRGLFTAFNFTRTSQILINH
jgi:hypothetical protein